MSRSYSLAHPWTTPSPQLSAEYESRPAAQSARREGPRRKRGPNGLEDAAAGCGYLRAAGTSPLLKGVGGRYFEDGNEALTVADHNGYWSGFAPYALDPANADRLWAVSLRLLA